MLLVRFIGLDGGLKRVVNGIVRTVGCVLLIKSASYAQRTTTDARVTRHIDAVDLATIYDDVSAVAASDRHYTAITVADSCMLCTGQTHSSLCYTFFTFRRAL